MVQDLGVARIIRTTYDDGTVVEEPWPYDAEDVWEPAPDESEVAATLEDLVYEAVDTIERGEDRYRAYVVHTSLGSVLDQIDSEIRRGCAGATHRALRLAIEEVDELVDEGIEDSYGTLSELLQRAVDLYAVACAKGEADPEEVADWLLDFRLRSRDVDSASAPLSVFADALGDRGLAILRIALDEADAAAQARGLLTQSRLTDDLLVELADLDGDVDGAVAILQREPADPVGIVRRLVVAGRGEAAVEWVDRARAAQRVSAMGATAHHLGAIEIAELYAALDRRHEALETMRTAFKDLPVWTVFRALGEFAGRFGLGEVEQSWARDEARRIAERKGGDGSALVSIALGQGDPDAAWRAADTYGPGSEGERLVDQTAESHPLRAVAHYRSRVERMLERPDAPLYPAVAALLVRMGDLAQLGGEAEAWREFVLSLRDRFRNRPALRRELDKARLPG